MKKLITVMMLSLFVMACKEDQRVTKSAELALAGAYIPR